MRVSIAGIGMLGPGLPGWEAARPVLRGEQTYIPAPCLYPPPPLLEGPERRRSSPAVRLALEAARQAVAAAGMAAAALPAVFASAMGDGLVTTRLLEVLGDPAQPVSPAQFHTSVHNAAAGYWTIGTRCHEASTAIAAADASFAAGLLKAAVQVVTERRPVLLVCYDDVLPPPLLEVRGVAAPLAVALVLVPATAQAALTLIWEADGGGAATPPRGDALARLWQDNPAARALPLLEALACGVPAGLLLAGPGGGRLRVTVAPC